MPASDFDEVEIATDKLKRFKLSDIDHILQNLSKYTYSL